MDFLFYHFHFTNSKCVESVRKFEKRNLKLLNLSSEKRLIFKSTDDFRKQFREEGMVASDYLVVKICQSEVLTVKILGLTTNPQW